MRTRDGREALRVRERERKWGGRVGEVLEQVREPGARNVLGRVALTLRTRDVRTALGRAVQQDGGVEDPQRGVAEAGRQRFRGDERGHRLR